MQRTEKKPWEGPVVSKVGRTSCAEVNATILNDVYKFKEKLGTYQCPRFVSESLSLLSPEISWGGGDLNVGCNYLFA